MNSQEIFVVLHFTGEKSMQLLQGQLSADIEAIEPSACVFSCICNPQGRLLATAVVCCISSDRYALLIPGVSEELITAQFRRLLPFFKVELTKGDKIYFSPPESESFIPQIAFEEPSADTTLISAKEWLINWWRRGVVFLCHTDQLEKYIPGDIGWDRFAVSFSKGCYTGQEIVARVHYRGKPKYDFIVGMLNKSTSQEVVTNDKGDEIGSLVDKLEDENNWLVAIRVMTTADKSNMHLGGQQVATLLSDHYE